MVGLPALTLPLCCCAVALPMYGAFSTVFPFAIPMLEAVKANNNL